MVLGKKASGHGARCPKKDTCEGVLHEMEIAHIKARTSLVEDKRRSKKRQGTVKMHYLIKHKGGY